MTVPNLGVGMELGVPLWCQLPGEDERPPFLREDYLPGLEGLEWKELPFQCAGAWGRQIWDTEVPGGDSPSLDMWVRVK